MPFSSSPVESNLSETGNFTLAIWKCQGISPIVKWSDDHNIFHFPIAGDGVTYAPSNKPDQLYIGSLKTIISKLKYYVRGRGYLYSTF